MKTLLALVLCASSLSLLASGLPKDTVDKYVIDNVAIDKFDGSQLVGKSISKYQITCKNAGKTVERRHVISTNAEDAAQKARGRHPGYIQYPGLNIVDGQEMPMGYKISQPEVARLIFHKPGSDAAKSYGEKGKNGVTIITTHYGRKKGKVVEVVVEETGLTTDYKGLIIVDGKEIKRSDLDRIKKNDVTSAYVLAPGSKAAKSYGAKGKNGVTIITTIKSTAGKTTKVIYIDGQKVDESEMNKLSPNNIAAMSVAKNSDGQTVAIYIETKEGKKDK